MGRPKQKFVTIQMRASIRETYDKAVSNELAKDNFFNPTKPAQGDYSKLVESLLREWLQKRKSSEFMNLLDQCKNLEQMKTLFPSLFEEETSELVDEKDSE